MMAVTKGWLENTGTKICVEDIRQMQLIYEDSDSKHGSLVGTRTLYLSEKGSLYQSVFYYEKERVNDRYPEGIELALNAEEVNRLRSGDRMFQNYQTCLSSAQKTAIWQYMREPETFKTVHIETKKEYAELTVKFGKGCMKEFDNGEEKYAEIRFKDGEQWKTFVVPRKYVHENNYGNGLWLKRNAEGRTKVTQYNSATKEKTEEFISNKELKRKVEAYKTKKKSR